MGEHGKHWPLVIRSACLAIACSATFAEAQSCRQALAVGLDVSGSVDPTEYQMQRDGLATALMSPAVRDVILRAGTAPIDIAVFEWSGPQHQVMLQPWITIDGADTLTGIAGNLRKAPRVNGSPTTAIGAALLFGASLLDQRPNCWKRTLDISGDGQANTGPRPQDVIGVSPTTVVNALVIGAASGMSETKELSSYFSAYVIRGSGAFVEVANGFEDYAEAMERKLLRELQSLALSAVDESH